MDDLMQTVDVTGTLAGMDDGRDGENSRSSSVLSDRMVGAGVDGAGVPLPDDMSESGERMKDGRSSSCSGSDNSLVSLSASYRQTIRNNKMSLVEARTAFDDMLLDGAQGAMSAAEQAKTCSWLRKSVSKIEGEFWAEAEFSGHMLGAQVAAKIIDDANDLLRKIDDHYEAMMDQLWGSKQSRSKQSTTTSTASEQLGAGTAVGASAHQRPQDGVSPVAATDRRTATITAAEVRREVANATGGQRREPGERHNSFGTPASNDNGQRREPGERHYSCGAPDDNWRETIPGTRNGVRETGDESGGRWPSQSAPGQVAGCGALPEDELDRAVRRVLEQQFGRRDSPRLQEQVVEQRRPALQKWAVADGPGKFSGKKEDFACWKKDTQRIMKEQEWTEAQIYSWLKNPSNMTLTSEQAYWVRIRHTSAGIWEALDDHFPKNGYALVKLANELRSVKAPNFNSAGDCRVFASALRGADEKAGVLGEQQGRDVLAEVFSRDMEAFFRREVLTHEWMDKVDELVAAEPAGYAGSVGWMRGLAEVARRRVTLLLRREEMEGVQLLAERRKDKGSRVSKVGPPSMVSEAAPVAPQAPATAPPAATPANNFRQFQRMCPWCKAFDHGMFNCPMLRGEHKKDRRGEASQAGRCPRCMMMATFCQKRCTGVATVRDRQWPTDCTNGCQWESRPVHYRLCACPDAEVAAARPATSSSARRVTIRKMVTAGAVARPGMAIAGSRRSRGVTAASVVALEGPAASHGPEEADQVPDSTTEETEKVDGCSSRTVVEDVGLEAVGDPAAAAKASTTVAWESRKNDVGNNLSVPLYEEVDARVQGKIRRLRVMYDSGATDTIVRRQEDAEWAFETLRVMDNHVMEDYSGKATVGQYNLKRVEIFGEGKWRRVEALEVDDVAPTQVVEVAVPDELTGLVGNNVVQQGGEVDLLLGQSHSGMFPVILGQTSGCMERPALAVYQSRLTGKKLLFGKADDYCRAVADPSSRISAAKAVVALNNTDGLTDMQPFRDKSAALLAVPGRVRIGLKFSVLVPEGLGRERYTS